MIKSGCYELHRIPRCSHCRRRGRRLYDGTKTGTDHDVLGPEAGAAGGDRSPNASGLIAPIPDLPEYSEASARAVDLFHSYTGTGTFELTRRPGLQLVSADEEEWGREHDAAMPEYGFDVT